MKLSPGSIVGDFVIEKRLAESGCASVYLAHREKTVDQKVAVKIAHSDGHYRGKKKQQKNDNPANNREVFYDLIRREADILSVLRHPGIVRIYPMTSASAKGRAVYTLRATSLDSQPYYFVMEYLPNNTLRKYIGKIKNFPLEWRLELFYQIMIVVDYIHFAGYAHCDLKPENIFFRREPRENEAPSPILIDFGTASHVDDLDTEPAASVPYVAPEILTLIYGRGIVEKSQIPLVPSKFDVWALGAIFYELVTGKKLIDDRDMTSAVSSIMRHLIPTINEAQKDVPAQLDVYLGAMLKRSPEERPFVEDLIEGLEHYLAPPPRIMERKKVGLFGS